jgi:hypothetical protein
VIPDWDKYWVHKSMSTPFLVEVKDFSWCYKMVYIFLTSSKISTGSNLIMVFWNMTLVFLISTNLSEEPATTIFRVLFYFEYGDGRFLLKHWRLSSYAASLPEAITHDCVLLRIIKLQIYHWNDCQTLPTCNFNSTQTLCTKWLIR